MTCPFFRLAVSFKVDKFPGLPYFATMNLVSPSEIARRITADTREPFTRQAVCKALDAGLIPFQAAGKKRLIDLDNLDVIAYMQTGNRQREQVKKNDTPPPVNPPSKLPDKKPAKRKSASKLPAENPVDLRNPPELPELEAFEIKRRSQLADMRKKELQVLILEKKYLPTDFIEDVYIAYIERLNSNVERLAGTFIKDVGKKILEAGEITSEHIELFNSKVLELIHNNKKSVRRQYVKYDPTV